MAMDKTYSAMYREAQTNGDIKEVTFTTKKSWDVGETLVGKIEQADNVIFNDPEKPVVRYILDSDEGRQAVILGRGMDTQLLTSLRIGDVVALTYQGKRELSGGRSMNVYKVECIQQGTGGVIQSVIAEAPAPVPEEVEGE